MTTQMHGVGRHGNGDGGATSQLPLAAPGAHAPFSSPQLHGRLTPPASSINSMTPPAFSLAFHAFNKLALML